MMTDLFDRDDLPLPHCLALQLADPAIPTAEICHLHNLTPTELATLAAHPDVVEQLSALTQLEQTRQPHTAAALRQDALRTLTDLSYQSKLPTKLTARTNETNRRAAAAVLRATAPATPTKKRAGPKPTRPINQNPKTNSPDRRGPSLSNSMVVLDRTARDTNRPDHVAARVLQRHPAGERDQPAVGMLDPIQRPTRLAQPADVARVHIKPTSRPRLLDRDIDRPQPRPVLTSKRRQVHPRVHHGDIHLRPNGLRLGNSRRNHLLCLIKRQTHLQSPISYPCRNAPAPPVNLANKCHPTPE